MATHKNTGSGIDQPQKAQNDAEKARRIEQERAAYDLDHKPTERDAQIDGSGARFRSDA